MIDFNRHIEIENYLSGSLSPEDKLLFEVKMASDPKLKAEVDLQKAANALVMNVALSDIKGKLDQIHKTEKSKSFNKKTLKVAAIVLAIASILALGYAYFSSKKDNTVPNNPDNTKLQSNYIENDLSDHSKPASQVDEKETTLLSDELTEQISPDKEQDDLNTSSNKNQTRSSNNDVQPIDVNELGHLDSNKSIDYENKDIALEKDNEQPFVTSSNPCEKTNNIIPDFSLSEPCFGANAGELKMENSKKVEFKNFKINGNSIYEYNEHLKLNSGNYEIVAIDENNCESKPLIISVKFAECNHVIRPNQLEFMELNWTDLHEPIVFEVRAAKTGGIVFSEMIENPNSYIYKGNDLNQTPLPTGNYVYTFKNKEGVFISRGQIAILK